METKVILRLQSSIYETFLLTINNRLFYSVQPSASALRLNHSLKRRPSTHTITMITYAERGKGQQEEKDSKRHQIPTTCGTHPLHSFPTNMIEFYADSQQEGARAFGLRPNLGLPPLVYDGSIF